MMRILVAMALAAAMLATPARAAGPGPAQSIQQREATPPPREMLEEGMQMVLRALELMIRAIPQYSAPEVLKNGDIIIRRLPSEPLPKEKPRDGGKERLI